MNFPQNRPNLTSIALLNSPANIETSPLFHMIPCGFSPQLTNKNKHFEQLFSRAKEIVTLTKVNTALAKTKKQLEVWFDVRAKTHTLADDTPTDWTHFSSKIHYKYFIMEIRSTDPSLKM